MSDAWLTGRARELLALIQTESPQRQPAVITQFDTVLSEARRRGEPRMLGKLLRGSAAARLVAPGLAAAADPLLEELLGHSRRYGLLVLEADAYALRGMRALFGGAEDNALTELAKALAMLDEDPVPELLDDHRDWYRQLSSALGDIALVLTQLGMYEDADPTLARAYSAIKQGGGPHEIVEQMINRARVLTSWGLRLERIGEQEAAIKRYTVAAEIAVAAERPYAESLFPRDHGRSAVDQVPVLAAAQALANPDPVHIPRLSNLIENSTQARHLILMTVALARCFERGGKAPDAMNVLIDARDRLASNETEQALRLSVLREYARLVGPEYGERRASALDLYVAELEAELWSRRTSQISALSARREHERLSRKHGAMARQAMQDPLTGLPNRRALDARLEELGTRTRPLSIALIDLDGFKAVNDRSSHAEGDNVLRVIASTLRDIVRGDDLVARYGGDEFVMLLPGAALVEAEAALGRAVEAVAHLPSALSRGVTLSVGVVTLLAHETPATALARADAAMYLAKRRGGNQVVAVCGDIPADGYPAADEETEPNSLSRETVVQGAGVHYTDIWEPENDPAGSGAARIPPMGP